MSDLYALRDELVAAHIGHSRVFVGLGLARAVANSDWLADHDAQVRRAALEEAREAVLALGPRGRKNAPSGTRDECARVIAGLLDGEGGQS